MLLNQTPIIIIVVFNQQKQFYIFFQLPLPFYNIWVQIFQPPLRNLHIRPPIQKILNLSPLLPIKFHSLFYFFVFFFSKHLLIVDPPNIVIKQIASKDIQPSGSVQVQIVFQNLGLNVVSNFNPVNLLIKFRWQALYNFI